MFSFFNKLPPEVRQKIWSSALNPRVVNIVYNKERGRYISPNTTIPSILHATNESRLVGLKSYELCFGTESYPDHIYFCLERDILFFDQWGADVRQTDISGNGELETPPWSSLRNKDRLRVHNIAIMSGYYDYAPVMERQMSLCSVMVSALRKFLSLEHFFIVIEEREILAPGKIEFFPTYNYEIGEFGIGVDHNCKYPPGCLICYPQLVTDGLSDIMDHHSLTWAIPKVSVVGCIRDGVPSSMGEYDFEYDDSYRSKKRKPIQREAYRHTNPDHNISEGEVIGLQRDELRYLNWCQIFTDGIYGKNLKKWVDEKRRWVWEDFESGPGTRMVFLDLK
jgi:hypothetical protein